MKSTDNGIGLKPYLSRLAKCPSFNIKEYKIIDCRDVYDEMLTWSMMISRSLITRRRDSLTGPHIQGFASVTSALLNRLSSSDKNFNDAVLNATLDIAADRGGTDDLMDYITDAHTTTHDKEQSFKPVLYAELSNNTTVKVTDKCAFQIASIISSPYILAGDMLEMTNLKFLYKMIRYIDAAADAVASHNHDIDQNTYSKLPLHPPFDKVIYVFGEFSIRYNRTTPTTATLTIMGESCNGVIDVAKSTIQLTPDGHIIRSNGLLYDDQAYSMRLSAKLLQDITDSLVLTKILDDPFLTYAVRTITNNAVLFDMQVCSIFRQVANPITMITMEFATELYMIPIIRSFVVATMLLTCKQIKTVSTPIFIESAKSKKKKSSNKSAVTRLEYSTISVSTEAVEYNKLTEDGDKTTDDATLSRSVITHIRRGHFKLYTKERPLFGKYSGLIWVPDTVVGKRTEKPKETSYSVSM